MSEHNDKLETLVIHGGQSPEPVTGAVMPPVFQTSTYVQDAVGVHRGYEYARTQNPTREALERSVACLEGGTHGVAFGSGSAATAAIQHLLPAGAKVVCGDDVYGGTWRQFTQLWNKRDIDYTFVDLSTADPAEAVPEGTHMVWLESPTNPLLKVTDIAALARRAREVGALVVVDNTFATPVFQKPLALGAHIVVHSTTKYINGHSDVVGGIVVTADSELAEKLSFVQNSIGAVPGPWDTWLTLRGIKTLALRMERHHQNAMTLADWLLERDEVSRVWYPFHPTHPHYERARAQMSGFGGMISFEMDADLAAAEKFCASTRIITLAESLGGVESLIELPAAMTHASIPPELRKEIGIADGLVRLSVGIEHIDDLVADLDQAFAAVS
ncbi:MAG: PLP-dependent aspartate aminotransferase family protein [Myxococcota bacterium]|nr:PLP-dependent aspartate aminotransferase family protein [Myxococcota bacterium]